MAAFGDNSWPALLGCGALIFVTVGSMMPFDRLIRRMDKFAAARPDLTFFAQIGTGTFEPCHMPFERIMGPRAFGDTISAADLIVAHAGMGSVLSALEAGRPIVLVPRRAAEGEVTTDHQLATARWLIGRPGVSVVLDDVDLPSAIEKAVLTRAISSGMPRTAPDDFVNRLRAAVIGRQ